MLAGPRPQEEQVSEPLGILLLPSKLEAFELVEHARDLLSIPRVVALEPSPYRTPRWLRESAPAKTASRIRFPGDPRMILLYHPRQYPLARALCARYEDAELWYVRPDPEQLLAAEELSDFDQLAAERAGASRLISQTVEPGELRDALRRRMVELEIISPHPFIPGARVQTR
jgi:hypothetical protein